MPTLRRTGVQTSLTMPDIMGCDTRPMPWSPRPSSSRPKELVEAAMAPPTATQARPTTSMVLRMAKTSPMRHSDGTTSAPASSVASVTQVAATALTWYAFSTLGRRGTSMLVLIA